MDNTFFENIEIVPFEQKHVAAVADIHARVADGWSAVSLAGDLENDTTRSYVAVYNGNAVAFCSYLVTEDAELVFVCTDPACRGKGIATKLLSETMAALPEKIISVVLEVRSRNETALKLYERLGFKKLGVRKNFYSHPQDDAVVMEYLKE